MWMLKLLLIQLAYILTCQLYCPVESTQQSYREKKLPVPTACHGWQNGVCKCSEAEKFVNCSSQKLTQFPIGIPNDTRALNVGNNMINSVPDLRHLADLQSINLNINNLSEVPTLPKTMGTIDLSENVIQNFSTEFVGMTYLVKLNIKRNLLKNLPDGGFTGCSWLSKLKLGYNSLKYINVNQLKGLESLGYLFLQNNSITDIDPAAMKIICKYGNEINFGTNKLTAIRPGFFNGCSIVDDLYLRDNIISKLPDYLFQNPESKDAFGVELGSVHFNNMSLEEIGVNTFYGVGHCQLLSLTMNRLKYIPKAVTNLNVLNYILLGNNMITEIPDFAFNGSRQVLGIFLDVNQLQRIPKNAFANLKQLKELYLFKNKIVTIELGAFKDNPLEKLYLFENNLVTIPQNLFRTPSRTITTLHLFFSPVKTIHSSAFIELADNATIIGTCSQLENIPKLQANVTMTCMSEFTVPKLEFPMIMCSTLKGYGYQCHLVFRHCFCIPCPKGYFGSSGTSNGCNACPPGGYYLDEIGVANGLTYYDNCKTCKHGTYVPPGRPGRSESDCQVCPFGTQTNQVAGSRACRCINNYYRIDRFGRCFMCTKRGIVCPFEYQLLKPGFWWYWQSDEDFYSYSNFTWALKQENYTAINGVDNTLLFVGSLPFAQECPRPKSCPGNTIKTSCADGFTGWMCSQCESGFYPWFDSCNKCPSVWHFFLVYGIIILALLILIGLIFWIDSKRSTDSEARTTADMILARAKIVIGFYQVLAGIFSTLNYIHWPRALANIGQHLQNIALNIIKIASPQCLDPRFKLNAYREFIFGITCPILMIILTIFIYLIKNLILKFTIPKYDRPLKMAETKRLCFQYTLSLLFLTYPNSCNTIFSLFPSICQAFWVDDLQSDVQSRLKSDYSISCEEDRYTIYMYAAYVSLLYVVGFPLGLLFLLWRFRFECILSTHKMSDPLLEISGDSETIYYQDPSNLDFVDDTMSQKTDITIKKTSGLSDPYGLRAFHESYNSRCWFWEVVELVRKLTLTSLVIFFGSTSRTQIGAAAFLAILFLILHVAFQPMKDTFEHWLQLLSLATIVLNLLIGVILMVPVDDSKKQSTLDKADDLGVQIILIIVDFGIILLFTVSTLRSLYNAFKHISKDNKMKKIIIDGELEFNDNENEYVNESEPLVL